MMFIASDDVCGGPKSGNCGGNSFLPHPRQRQRPRRRRLGASPTKIGTGENINVAHDLTNEGSAPFMSSNHSGGANAAFCDGSIRFISNTIDGTVYAKIITPNGSKLPPQYRQLPVDGDSIGN